MVLNLKQQRFVDEYMIDASATGAARRAGYKQPHSQGPRLLENVGVKAEIERRQSVLAKKLEVNAEHVVTELARIGFSDPRLLLDENDALKPIRMLPYDVAASIASVEVFEEYEGRGKQRKLIGYTKKVRFWDKVSALEKLGKHLDLFKDIHEHRGSIALQVLRVIRPPTAAPLNANGFIERQALNAGPSANGTSGEPH